MYLCYLHRGMTAVKSSRVSDELRFREAGKQGLRSNYYPNKEKLSQIYTSFENTRFNSTHDADSIQGRTTTFRVMGNRKVEENLKLLEAELQAAFPGMDYSVIVRDDVSFAITITTASLEQKYFTCRDVLKSKRFWQLLLLFVSLCAFVYYF